MTTPIFHNFENAPTHVAPFSHAVECDGWIQLTGQMPTDPNDDDQPLAAMHMYRVLQRMDDVANACEAAANAFLPIVYN